MPNKTAEAITNLIVNRLQLKQQVTSKTIPVLMKKRKFQQGPTNNNNSRIETVLRMPIVINKITISLEEVTIHMAIIILSLMLPIEVITSNIKLIIITKIMK